MSNDYPPPGYGTPQPPQNPGYGYPPPSGYPQQGQQGYPQQGPGFPAAPPGYPPAYAQPGMAPMYAPMAPSNSGLATASLICGIVGLCVSFAGIAAVITGHMALSQIKASNGAKSGRGLAIAGLVLGYIEIALLVLVIIFLIANGGNLSTGTATP